MIKINLIPSQTEKNLFKEDIYLFILITFLCFIAVAGFYYKNNKDIEEKKRSIQHTKNEIASLQKIYKEYLAMEQQKKEIERRMKAIESIKEGRALSVRILYDITNIIKDNVWFKNFNKADGKFEIEGISLENESISDFIEKLAKIPYMRNIELLKVEDEQDKRTNVMVKKFIIKGEIAL